MKCPFCEKETREGVQFCTECGHKISYCPTCGKVIEYKTLFCPEDGTKLSEQLTQDLPERGDKQEPSPKLGKEMAVDEEYGHASCSSSYKQEPCKETSLDESSKKINAFETDKQSKKRFPILHVVILIAVIGMVIGILGKTIGNRSVEISGFLMDFDLAKDKLSADELVGDRAFNNAEYYYSERYGLQLAHMINSEYVELLGFSTEGIKIFGIKIGINIKDAKKILQKDGWEYDENQRCFTKTLDNGIHIGLNINADYGNGKILYIGYWADKNEVSPERVSFAITDEQQVKLKQALNVPDKLDASVSATSLLGYWDAAGRYCRSIGIYSNGEEIAGATIDPETMELLRNIFGYYEE